MSNANTERFVFNPFDEIQPTQTAVASSVSSDVEHDREVATASALTNMSPNQCPKCGNGMGGGILADGEKVFYCPPCRVTNPIPVPV